MARKAVTPLAALLIIVAITVVSSLVTYMWVTSYTGSLDQATEAIQLNEILRVERARYGGGRLQVTVRNIGSRKATITAVYVLRQDRTVVFARTDMAVDLEPGAAATLEVEAELGSGTYIVKLVTKTGVEATTMLTWIAPPQQEDQPPEEEPETPPEEQPRMVNLWIIVEPPEGGSTYTYPPLDNHTIPAGTTLAITALPNPGYLFSHWLLNGVSYPGDQSITLTVFDDMTLTAVFQKQPEEPPPEQKKIVLQITVYPPEGGTTEPWPGVYEMDAGTEYSITAIAKNDSYIFLHWLLNGSYFSSDERITIIVDKSMSLTAVFAERQRGAPSFNITYCSKVSGPVGSTQTFTTAVKNRGDREGSVTVKVLNDKGALIAQETRSLQPGETKSISFTLTLPTTRGSYNWRVIAENTETQNVDDEETFTVEAKNLYPVKQAIYFTTFENPPEGWSAWGGSWSIAAREGHRGTNALQGDDDDKGPGKVSLYYRELPSSAVYVAVQVRSKSNPERFGLALLDSTGSTVTIYSANLDYTGKDRGFAIERFYNNKWETIQQSGFKPVNNASYTLIIKWEAQTLTAYVYDSNGVLCALLTSSASGFTPRYVALIIDGKGKTNYFDNFIITSVDPRYIQVRNLTQGWKVELFSGTTRISNTTAGASGVATLPVITNLIVVDARIVVKDAQDNLIIERSFSEVVGGDEYVYGT